MACVPVLVLDDAHISGGILGEKGVVGEDGGEEKKTSRGDKMPGVLRCLPIMETPIAGLRGVLSASLSSLCVRMVRFGTCLEVLAWPAPRLSPNCPRLCLSGDAKI